MTVVSVCMAVYNQEAFVGHAIEGVLGQECPYEIQLVIADDCSTDATRSICEKYTAENPGRIKYIERKANLGMMGNFIATLNDCTGDYIAICEGDDYWIDSDKIRQQVSFLETNPDYSLITHDHFLLRNGSLEEPEIPELPEGTSTVIADDYILNPFFHTASYLFRRSALPGTLPAWYKSVLAGDHFLVLLLSTAGRIAFINSKMSVFRQHDSSFSRVTRQLEIKNNFVDHLRIFDAFSEFKHSVAIQRVIKRWEISHRVYEPIGYFERLTYFLKQTHFYVDNFDRVGGFGLLIKYLLPQSILRRVTKAAV